MQPKPNNLLLPTCLYEIKKEAFICTASFSSAHSERIFCCDLSPSRVLSKQPVPASLQAMGRAVIFNSNSFNIPMCWCVAEVTHSGLCFSGDPPLDIGDVSWSVFGLAGMFIKIPQVQTMLVTRSAQCVMCGRTGAEFPVKMK